MAEPAAQISSAPSGSNKRKHQLEGAELAAFLAFHEVDPAKWVDMSQNAKKRLLSKLHRIDERNAPAPLPPPAENALRSVALTVEYDGTDFHGSQLQTEGVRTVQGVIEQTICSATHDSDPRALHYKASSRTDAGVHAIGQLVIFQTRSSDFPEADLMRHALNSRLPDDVVVRSARFLGPGEPTDPRLCSKGKWYQYVLHCGAVRSSLRRRDSWAVGAVDMQAVRQAAALLQGKHDFSSFCDPNTESTGHNVCDVQSIDVCNEESTTNLVRIDIKGNRFLYKMIRIIVGTLVEVGRGTTKVSQISAIIEAADRSMAGSAAPPRGLTLMEVFPKD